MLSSLTILAGWTGRVLFLLSIVEGVVLSGFFCGGSCVLACSWSAEIVVVLRSCEENLEVASLEVGLGVRADKHADRNNLKTASFTALPEAAQKPL